ncbi:MAG TPA: hypothetical protein PKJ24_01380 [Prolixibacteraceae bacterium]|nr:hypothetical protein [Prolixibacteraceae bacterium]
MRIFVDANLLVATLNKEYPLFLWSSRLLSLHATRNIVLYTSPLCLAIAFYFAGKKCGEKTALFKISLLCQHLQVTTINEVTIQKVLDDPRVTDFEDGLEYFSALETPCDFIITENCKDFWFSSIPVMNCETFLTLLSQNKLP